MKEETKAENMHNSGTAGKASVTSSGDPVLGGLLFGFWLGASIIAAIVKPGLAIWLMVSVAAIFFIRHFYRHCL